MVDVRATSGRQVSFSHRVLNEYYVDGESFLFRFMLLIWCASVGVVGILVASLRC